MISYTVENANLVHVLFKGPIRLNDIISFLNEFDKIEGLSQNLRLLYDLHEANFEFEPGDINIINTQAQEVTMKYSTVRTAFVVNDPKSTAYSILFKSSTQRAKRELFSNKSNAIDWLNKPA